MSAADRHEAGRRLARALEPHLRLPAVVYALPPGGVPVAAEIALAHRLPLDLVIARDLDDPLRPGAAVCAVTEAGAAVCTPDESARIDPAWLAQSLAERRGAAQHERAHYRAGHRRRSAAGCCAIMVDDGAATPLALEAALRELRADAPARLLLALPAAPDDLRERLRTLCDGVVALESGPPELAPLADDDISRDLARVQQAAARWIPRLG